MDIGIIVFLILTTAFVQCNEVTRILERMRGIGSQSASDNYADEFLDSYQLIVKYGFRAEKHAIVTEDGFLLNHYRIPGTGPAVVLAHGIADSSDSWLVLGPEDSLAFHLAEAGFDVWLYNSRGNKYCKENVQNISKKDFWNFSFEEMGAKDMPATIDYILGLTGRTKVFYVGFSQGTTILLTMCSLRPEYNDKIQHAVLLAPVAWIHVLKYPMADMLSKNVNAIMQIFDSLQIYEIYSWNPIRNVLHADYCKQNRTSKILCQLEYLFNFGIDIQTKISPEKFPVIASHIPAGSSLKSFVHFLQLYNSKGFDRFDYGSKINEKVYKRKKAPAYEVSLTTAPVTLFASESDWFSSTKSVTVLQNSLPNLKQKIVFNKTLQFSHLEFVYGSRVRNLVNNRILDIFYKS